MHKFFSVVLPIVFLLITLGGFLWHVYVMRADIFATFDHTYWQKRYEASQWFVKNSKNPIGDDGLYAYVGYAYVTGDDPTLLNAEVPPFGKYVIGLFEITTGKMGTFSLCMAALSLVLLHMFTKMTTKSSFLASLSVMIFSFEPLFVQQIRAPFLDTLYLSLFLLSAIFFLKEKYIMSGVALGLFMSTKSPFLGILVLLTYSIVLAVTKRPLFKTILILSSSAAVIYIATYLRMFFLGQGFIHFLQVQKYIIHFYSSGAKGVIGAVFSMFLQGKWPTWFGPTLSVGEWTIFWMIGFFGMILSFFLFFQEKKKTIGLWIHMIWVVVYLAFLIVAPIFPRYLLLLLPFLYNLSIWVFLKGISVKYSWVLSS